MEQILDTLLATAHAYRYVIVFFGAMLAGESIILPAMFLAAQGSLSATAVLALALLGNMISDSFWFWLGKHHEHLHRIKPNYHELFERFKVKIETISRNPSRSLLYMKFLYGLRVLTIIYLSAIYTPYRTFLWYDTLGSLIWLLTFLIFTSLITIGYTTFSHILPSLRVIIPILIVIIVCIKLCLPKLRNRISQV